MSILDKDKNNLSYCCKYLEIGCSYCNSVIGVKLLSGTPLVKPILGRDLLDLSKLQVLETSLENEPGRKNKFMERAKLIGGSGFDKFGTCF